MPKSLAEIERLKINAQNQNHLLNAHLKRAAINETQVKGINRNQSSDVYQPTGEIDYSRFNKAASKS
jgi:hypothetical protein